MAKVDDTTSTIDWIWLGEALVLAAVPFKSQLAKEWLVHSMATGDLPWDCKLWKPLNAEVLAKWEERRRENEGWGHFSPVPIRPSPEYFRGDPRFWNADLKIDWEGDGAREKAAWGAKASGIKVSREHLLALLPKEPRERAETPEPTKSEEREKLGPKEWLVWALKEYPKKRNERPTPYIRRLHNEMQNADNVTEVWALKTFRIRYYEAVKLDSQAVQKARKAPRTL